MFNNNRINHPPLRTLLVDDEINLAEIAKMNLESVDSSLLITITSSPLTALRLLTDQAFDCVVSDYQMPTMSGIQLCAEIRKTSDIPFIIYTGRGSEEVASTAFAVGADDYIRKEKEISHYLVLARRIRNVVEKKKNEEALRKSVKELEEVNEELAVSEEELRVSNEELRSSNEQLRDSQNELADSREQVQKYANELEEKIQERTAKLTDIEERLRLFMDSATDGFAIYDNELRLVDLNKEALKRLPKGTTKSDIIGKRITEIYPGIEKTQWYPAYLEVLRTGETYHSEGRSVGIQGSIQLFASAFKMGAGLGVVSRDITRRKNLEKRLQEAEVIAAVEQMGATVAHDLRGPLGVIVQSIQMAKNDPSIATRMCQIAEENATRSLKMISVWRSSTQKIVPSMVKTDLCVLINDVLKGTTIPSGVIVDAFIDNALESVKLDPEIMHRVFENLVQNAIEAMPNGGMLTIRGKIVENNLVVSIGDTGIGIPEEAKERVWLPLFTTKVGGMGLGLTYCKRAIEAMNGSIDFKSNKGEGTVFTISIPIQ